MITTTASVCDVARTLGEVRAATGYSQRKNIRIATASGSVKISGLSGSARFEQDLRNGRYAEQFDVAVMGKTAEVYDGTTVWAKDISGGVHSYDTAFPAERAKTDAFFASAAYLNPGSGASYRCLGAIQSNGRSITVIRMQPRGGIPADVGIDERTHLPVTVKERFPIMTRVTAYSDYRTIQGVVLPFVISQGSEQEPDDGFVFKVKQYTLSARSGAADFAKPSVDQNVAMDRGAASTTIPMTLEGRQLLVWASIDGHAPMPFILDTGGHAILTAGAAKALGLAASGAGESGGAGAGTIGTRYTRVKSIRLGSAQLLDQPMLIIDYPYAFYERGRRQPLAGILGLEIFEHFATRIDYGARKVTLTPYGAFSYTGNGTRIPFGFQDDMPMIDAAADGKTGMFGTDTGNAGTLILFGDFLKRTGLAGHYPGGDVVIGHGTGGQNTGRLVTLHDFTIGSHTVRNVPADFTDMSRGAFSSWTEAGNLGYEILSRFIPTYDYEHETLYLDKCSRECVPPQNLTGMRVQKNEPAFFTVASVAHASAAARAGIAAGDRIVAVNGRPASDFSRADLWSLMIRPDAPPLRLRIQRSGLTITRIVTYRTLR